MRRSVRALGMMSGLLVIAGGCGDSSRNYHNPASGTGGLVGSGGAPMAGGGAGGVAPTCLPLGATGCGSSCCQAGLTCVQDQCAQNSCLGDGVACSGPAQCCSATVDKCLLGQCGPATCRQTGESCTEDFTCCADAYCSAASRCVARAALGAACSDTVPCQAGLRCNTTTNRCESCTSDGGLVIACLAISFRCMLGALGATCTQPADCCSRHCVAGTCEAVCFDLGQVCSQDSDCCSGQCRQNLCVYTACKAAGAACTTDINCCSNHCGAGSVCL